MGSTPEEPLYKALKPAFSPWWSVWDNRNEEYLHHPDVDPLEVTDYEPIHFDSQEDAEAMAALLNSWEFPDE
jgi:hypothetical protein